MINIVCCKDCKDRKVGCHGQCKKYIEEKAEKERKKVDTKMYITRAFKEV